jgi:hypothetical protein
MSGLLGLMPKPFYLDARKNAKVFPSTVLRSQRGLPGVEPARPVINRKTGFMHQRPVESLSVESIQMLYHPSEISFGVRKHT